MSSRSIEILLVEDNPADVMFTRQALEDAKLLNHMQVLEDGASALAYLRRQPPYTGATTPDMVLLDLHLPGIDGQEVLKTIKEDEDLKHIPVVVLTNSMLKSDVERAYRAFANCYIVKPVDRDRFLTAIRELKRFWIDIVNLPPKGV